MDPENPGGMGEDFSFVIPAKILREFQGDLRVVIRHPWTVGIPPNEFLLKKGILEELTDLEPMLVIKKR